MDARLKVIKTEKDYDRALADFEGLFEAAEGSPDAEKREVLALLIKHCEDERFLIDLPSPVAAIKFRMEQAGLSQKDLVPFIGSKSKVSEVLSGKRELSLAMIRALNRHLDIPAETFSWKLPGSPTISISRRSSHRGNERPTTTPGRQSTLPAGRIQHDNWSRKTRKP
jgi:HTH-type transcriptional regulator/antitoxin HigA